MISPFFRAPNRQSKWTGQQVQIQSNVIRFPEPRSIINATPAASSERLLSILHFCRPFIDYSNSHSQCFVSLWHDLYTYTLVHNAAPTRFAFAFCTYRLSRQQITQLPFPSSTSQQSSLLSLNCYYNIHFAWHASGWTHVQSVTAWYFFSQCLLPGFLSPCIESMLQVHLASAFQKCTCSISRS